MYSKLPNLRSIRLLDIAPGKAPDRIEVSLMVVNLGEAPEFEALSYVWGPLNDPSEIVCDNEVAFVTQNLYAALQRLRQVDEARRVWIDALCINQNDFDERAQQVSFMKDVYARAKHVVVWLGPDEDDKAALAIAIIDSAAEYVVRRIKEVPTTQEALGEDEETFQLKIGTKLPPHGHHHWEAVWWMFSREWFSRVWIVQEIAQDEGAMMMVGDQTMSYTSATAAAMLFRTRFYSTQVSEDLESLVPVIVAYPATQTRKNSHPPPPLLEILNFFSIFKATNPRDKVYAILGLSKEGQELDKHPLIRPDYRKSVLQTYTDLVRQLISAPRSQSYGQGGLDVLGRTNIARHLYFRPPPEPDNQEYWPSWVPHLYKSVCLHNSLSNYNRALSWNTSYDSAVELGPMRTGSLVLKGLRLSTVKKLYTNPDHYKPDGPNLAGLFEQVKQDLTDYGGPGTLVEAFAQTITTGDPNVVSEHDLVSNDDRLGYGPLPMLGSEVWLLFGGRTLYLLHPLDTCYAFIGECYVHGYMNGEGMDMWKAGKLQSEWVELR